MRHSLPTDSCVPLDFQQITDGINAVSKLGCSGPMFGDTGTKINGVYYRDELLLKQLLPAIAEIAYVCVQHDSAPAHRACVSWHDDSDTQAFPARETPQFIGPEIWPSNRPDLHRYTTEFGVSLMQERMYWNGRRRYKMWVTSTNAWLWCSLVWFALCSSQSVTRPLTSDSGFARNFSQGVRNTNCLQSSTC